MNVQENALTAHELFLCAWKSTSKIPFNPKWCNSTTYYDNACDDEDLKLEKGQMVASTSEGANNRKILLKGVGDGLTVVIFERFTAGEGGVIVSNSPGYSMLKKLGLEDKVLPDLGHTSLQKNHVENFLNFN